MAGRPGVAEVHDLHIWDVTSGMPALSAHVLVDPTGDCHQVRRDIEVLLKGTYRIDHTTLQVDHAENAAPTAAGRTRTARTRTDPVTNRRLPPLAGRAGTPPH